MRILDFGVQKLDNTSDRLKVYMINLHILISIIVSVSVLIGKLYSKAYFEVISISYYVLGVVISFFFNKQGRFQLAAVIIFGSTLLTVSSLYINVDTFIIAAPFLVLIVSAGVAYAVKKTFLKYLVIIPSVIIFHILMYYGIKHKQFVDNEYYRFAAISIAIMVGILFFRIRFTKLLSKIKDRLATIETDIIIERKRNLHLEDNLSVQLELKQRLVDKLTHNLKEGETTLSAREIKKMIFEIELESEIDKGFKEKIVQSQIQTDFEEGLKNNYKDLTKTELKICNYIRMGMSTKDIAQIQDKMPNTINVTKSRIRKKMGLTSDLEAFLQSF